MTIFSTTIKASRRSAFVIAAGVWMCIAGPMRATESDARPADATAAATTPDKPVILKPAKQSQGKKAASAKSAKSAKLTKDDAAKTDPKKSDDADAAKTGETDQAMSPAVANANAQIPANAPTETPATLAAKADDILKGVGGKPGDDAAMQPSANMQLVSADQLNEVDRAVATETPAPAATAAATTAAPSVATSSDSTTLDQTSLIGKVFIAFGGILTLASAARMFIA